MQEGLGFPDGVTELLSCGTYFDLSMFDDGMFDFDAEVIGETNEL